MAALPMFVDRPSPTALYTHIMFTRDTLNRCFTITKPKEPWAPWYELPKNANIETRPCHHRQSRIHTLSCGHTIAVARDAEPCATNCTPLITDREVTGSARLSTANHPTIVKIRTSASDAITSYANGLIDLGIDPAVAEVQWEMHFKILAKVCENQALRLRPKVDLVAGDFSCGMCETQGSRASMPAYILYEEPFNCIMVGRGDKDRAVIRELQLGTVPSEPAIVRQHRQRRSELSGRGRGNGSGSGGGSGSGSGSHAPRGQLYKENLRRVASRRNSRITKARVAEKSRMLVQLRDEAFVDELEGLGLGL